MKVEDVKEEDLETSDEDTEDPEDDSGHGNSEEETPTIKEQLAKAQEIAGNMQKALKETRGKSKATIDAMRRRMSQYEEKLAELTKKAETSDLATLDEYDDADLVTVAAFKGILGARQEKHDAELEQGERQWLRRRTN